MKRESEREKNWIESFSILYFNGVLFDARLNPMNIIIDRTLIWIVWQFVHWYIDSMFNQAHELIWIWFYGHFWSKSDECWQISALVAAVTSAHFI